MRFITSIAVLLISLALAQCSKEDMLKLLYECEAIEGVSDAERQAYMDSNFDERMMTSSLKCAHKCALVSSGTLVNGVLQVEPIIRQFELPMDIVQQALNLCNKETGINECDDAFQKERCMINALNLQQLQVRQ